MGKEWAVDDAPTALSTTTSTTLLPDPENFSLPNSYAEAMTRPNIWSGLIEKELRVMRDRGVWEEMTPL